MFIFLVSVVLVVLVMFVIANLVSYLKRDYNIIYVCKLTTFLSASMAVGLGVSMLIMYIIHTVLIEHEEYGLLMVLIGVYVAVNTGLITSTIFNRYKVKDDELLKVEQRAFKDRMMIFQATYVVMVLLLIAAVILR